MKKIIFVLCLFCTLIFISGCSSFTMDDEAQTLIHNFYENIRTKNYENNLQYFSNDFYSVTTKEDTLKLFNIVNEKVGNLQTYELQNQMVTQITGGTKKPAGKIVRVSYLVTGSNGTTTDSFTLFRPNGGTYKIDGFHTEIALSLDQN